MSPIVVGIVAGDDGPAQPVNPAYSRTIGTTAGARASTTAAAARAAAVNATAYARTTTGASQGGTTTAGVRNR